jgi:tRNA-binding protein
MGAGDGERGASDKTTAAEPTDRGLETRPTKDDTPPPVTPTASEPTDGSTAAVQSSEVWNAFSTVEIRVGRVVEALPFPEARKPAFKVQIDFGEFGTRWSSAQITDRYSVEELVGRQIMAVTNLPPKRIAGFVSECLTLGVPDADGSVVLIAPDEEVPLGSRLF